MAAHNEMPKRDYEYMRHEALHVTALIENLIEQELLMHPAIQANDKWDDFVKTALKAMRALYHAIGEEHLS